MERVCANLIHMMMLLLRSQLARLAAAHVINGLTANLITWTNRPASQPLTDEDHLCLTELLNYIISLMLSTETCWLSLFTATTISTERQVSPPRIDKYCIISLPVCTWTSTELIDACKRQAKMMVLRPDTTRLSAKYCSLSLLSHLN